MKISVISAPSIDTVGVAAGVRRSQVKPLRRTQVADEVDSLTLVTSWGSGLLARMASS